MTCALHTAWIINVGSVICEWYKKVSQRGSLITSVVPVKCAPALCWLFHRLLFFFARRHSFLLISTLWPWPINEIGRGTLVVYGPSLKSWSHFQNFIVSLIWLHEKWVGQCVQNHGSINHAFCTDGWEVCNSGYDRGLENVPPTNKSQLLIT